ncbi:hypothetical protein G6O67_003612 [Ophiocordyceps sinensis]|uniref:Uncharacterized protein n=1 Tax=Ophiocordyceps sinensis TaxID=72228 RepID=A0A8H4PS65_9HYPO|nr:hypothetical protein G6O67_003612 [Ophiocordyceps sinensis]
MKYSFILAALTALQPAVMAMPAVDNPRPGTNQSVKAAPYTGSGDSDSSKNSRSTSTGPTGAPFTNSTHSLAANTNSPVNIQAAASTNSASHPVNRKAVASTNSTGHPVNRKAAAGNNATYSPAAYPNSTSPPVNIKATASTSATHSPAANTNSPVNIQAAASTNSTSHPVNRKAAAGNNSTYSPTANPSSTSPPVNIKAAASISATHSPAANTNSPVNIQAAAGSNLTYSPAANPSSTSPPVNIKAVAGNNSTHSTAAITNSTSHPVNIQAAASTNATHSPAATYSPAANPSSTSPPVNIKAVAGNNSTHSAAAITNSTSHPVNIKAAASTSATHSPAAGTNLPSRPGSKAVSGIPKTAADTNLTSPLVNKKAAAGTNLTRFPPAGSNSTALSNKAVSGINPTDSPVNASEVTVLIAVRQVIKIEIVVESTIKGGKEAGLSDESANVVAQKCQEAVGGKSITTVEQVNAYYAAVIRFVFQETRSKVEIRYASVFGSARGVVEGAMGRSEFTEAYIGVGLATMQQGEQAEDTKGCLNDFVVAINKQASSVSPTQNVKESAGPGSVAQSPNSPQSQSPKSPQSQPSQYPQSPQSSPSQPAQSGTPSKQDIERTLLSARDAASASCKTGSCRAAVDASIRISITVKIEILLLIVQTIHNVSSEASTGAGGGQALALQQQFADNCVTGAQGLASQLKDFAASALGIVQGAFAAIPNIPPAVQKQVNEGIRRTADAFKELGQSPVAIPPSYAPPVSAATAHNPAPNVPGTKQPSGGQGAPQSNDIQSQYPGSKVASGTKQPSVGKGTPQSNNVKSQYPGSKVAPETPKGPSVAPDGHETQSKVIKPGDHPHDDAPNAAPENNALPRPSATGVPKAPKSSDTYPDYHVANGNPNQPGAPTSQSDKIYHPIVAPGNPKEPSAASDGHVPQSNEKYPAPNVAPESNAPQRPSATGFPDSAPSAVSDGHDSKSNDIKPEDHPYKAAKGTKAASGGHSRHATVACGHGHGKRRVHV